MAPWHRKTSIGKFIYCRLYSFRFWWYFLSLFAKLCTLFTRFPTVLQFSFKNTNLSLLPSPVNWDVFYTITYTWSSVTSFKKYMFSCYWLFWRCRNKILSWIISLNSNKLKTSYWNSLRLKIYSLESCQSLFSCKSIRCNFPGRQLMIQAQFAMKIYNHQVIVKLFVLLTAVFWKAVETQSTGKLHLG